MKFRKLLVVFLIPAALFFASCENEIPEEFLFEVSPNSTGMRNLDDIDYVTLTLIKLPDHEIESNQSTQLPIVTINLTIEEYPTIFRDKRLNKGEILRLEGLESGKYKLTGTAYEVDYGNSYAIGQITGKGNKMDDHGNIIIDDFSPTIVKLVYTCDQY